MEYIWYVADQPIGKFRPIEVDDGMGVVAGEFHTLPAFESVRAVFAGFAAGVATGDYVRVSQYYSERDALGVVVRTVAGLNFPTDFVHIENIPADPPATGPFSAEIVANDRIVFEDDRFGLRSLVAEA